MPKMVGNKGEWTVKIPTMKDRARQALSLQALDPIAATLADPNSYGLGVDLKLMGFERCTVGRPSGITHWIL
jgi:hypothetical protein